MTKAQIRSAVRRKEKQVIQVVSQQMLQHLLSEVERKRELPGDAEGNPEKEP